MRLSKLDLIDFFLSKLFSISFFRSLLRYSTNYIEGMQYGSYAFTDEVHLALSFVNKSRGGGD